MPINPYLHFNGTCREAMEAYRVLLGGQLDLMTYSQTPDAPEPFASSDRVMHSALMTEHGDIQGSDGPPGQDGPPQASVSVHLQAPTVAEGRRIHDGLAAGGTVTVPFGPTFFAPGFSMLTDRFGTHWILSVTPES